MEPTSVTQSATLRQTSGDEQLRQSQPEKGSNTSEGRGEGGRAVFPSVGIKQQENINFSFKLWKTGTETYEILATVYGSYAKYCTQSSNDWEGSRWGMIYPERDARHRRTSTAQKQETAAVCGLFSFGLLPQVH